MVPQSTDLIDSNSQQPWFCSHIQFHWPGLPALPAPSAYADRQPHSGHPPWTAAKPANQKPSLSQHHSQPLRSRQSDGKIHQTMSLTHSVASSCPWIKPKPLTHQLKVTCLPTCLGALLLACYVPDTLMGVPLLTEASAPSPCIWSSCFLHLWARLVSDGTFFLSHYSTLSHLWHLSWMEITNALTWNLIISACVYHIIPSGRATSWRQRCLFTFCPHAWAELAPSNMCWIKMSKCILSTS